MFFGAKHFLGAGDIAQRENGRQQRFYFAARDVSNQIGKHPRRRNCRTAQCQVFQIKRTKVKINHRAGNGAGTSIAPALAQHRNKLRPHVAANNIGDNINRIIAG